MQTASVQVYSRSILFPQTLWISLLTAQGPLSAEDNACHTVEQSDVEQYNPNNTMEGIVQINAIWEDKGASIADWSCNTENWTEQVFI